MYNQVDSRDINFLKISLSVSQSDCRSLELIIKEMKNEIFNLKVMLDMALYGLKTYKGQAVCLDDGDNFIADNVLEHIDKIKSL